MGFLTPWKQQRGDEDKLSVESTFLDRAIGYFSPSTALNRRLARISIKATETLSYQGGKLSRETGYWNPSGYAGDIDQSKTQRLRNKALDLYSDSPYARAIVNGIVSRIANHQLRPTSLAIDADGDPDELFKGRVNQLWQRWAVECDAHGFPGYGGQNITGLLRQILSEVILCGECFVHLRPITTDEAATWKLAIPFVIDVIECERVREDISVEIDPLDSNNRIFRGIVFNRDTGRRVAYQVLDQNPRTVVQPAATLAFKRVPAEEMLHVYIPTRPGQMRGISWFAPVVDSFKLVANMQYYEQVAAAVNACMALVWETPPSGGGTGFGLQGAASATDQNGNPQSLVEPGQIIKGPPGAKLNSTNTSRPNLNITEFVTHILRGIAASFPLKSSQVTQDYRGASFSSEAACELDLWHSVLSLHDWFVSTTLRPIFEELVLTARLSGYFKGFETSLSADPYDLKLVDAQFPPPELRSINPNQDVTAAWTRIKSGLSSIEQECAKLGNDPFVVIDQNSAVRKKVIESGLPDPWTLSILGVDPKLDPSPATPDGSKENEAEGP